MSRNNQYFIDLKHSAVYRMIKIGLSLFPLTLQGLILLIVTALCLSVFGYGSMDLVVFALAICALAILIFCLFCSVISGVFVQQKIQKQVKKSERYCESIKVEAGFPNETGFSIPTVNLLPLVKLSWKITFPDHIETRTRVDVNNYLVEEIIPGLSLIHI